MTQTIEAKLIRGPMNGRTMKVERGTETINIGGFWQYTYAGKSGKYTLFVKRPRQRRIWRAILSHIAETGRHPWV